MIRPLYDEGTNETSSNGLNLILTHSHHFQLGLTV